MKDSVLKVDALCRRILGRRQRAAPGLTCTGMRRGDRPDATDRAGSVNEGQRRQAKSLGLGTERVGKETPECNTNDFTSITASFWPSG